MREVVTRGAAVGFIILGLAVVLGLVHVQRSLSASQHDLAVRAYEQDVRSWHEKLGGCVRNKIDRRVNREGWATARRARIAAAHLSSGASRVANLNAAAAYRVIVRSFGDRIEGLDCLVAYPEPIRPAGVRRSREIVSRSAWARSEDRKAADLERRIQSLSFGF